MHLILQYFRQAGKRACPFYLFSLNNPSPPMAENDPASLKLRRTNSSLKHSEVLNLLTSVVEFRPVIISFLLIFSVESLH